MTVLTRHAWYLALLVEVCVDEQRSDEIVCRHGRLLDDVAHSFGAEAAHPSGREL